MSSFAEDESITPEQFAASVFAEIEGADSTADTAEAPAETQVADDGTDTGESRPHVEDATGRLHDPETGKFIEKPEDEEGSDEAETQAEDQQAEDEQEDSAGDFVIEVDDEETADRVQAVLEKYDGDPAKALLALVEAQSLIGRKGNEAAQANAELDQVRAELAQIKDGQDAVLQRLSQPVVPITNELIETDPASAAEQAVLQDNVQALQAAIGAWQNGTDYVDANPEAARYFLEKLALEAQIAEQHSQASAEAPVADATQAQLDVEVQKVVDRHPDLEQYVPAIAEAANENPLLQRAMETGTPSERAQALEALTVIAKSRQGADTSREALQRVQIRVKQEADDAKRSARVVSASRGTAAAAGQPTGVDQFLAAFDAHLGLDMSGE